MTNIKLTGYHGNAKKKVYDAHQKKDYHVSEGNDHWLGNGTYFFCEGRLGNALEHAKFWVNAKHDGTVLKAEIETKRDKLCDLDDVETCNIINELKEVVINSMLKELGYSKNTTGKKAHIDGIFFNMWDKYFPNRQLNAIMRSDFYQTPAHKKRGTTSGTANATAICVRNVQCITNTSIIEE